MREWLAILSPVTAMLFSRWDAEIFLRSFLPSRCFETYDRRAELDPLVLEAVGQVN